MFKTFCSLLLSLLCLCVYAQDGKGNLKAAVITAEASPLEGVSVELVESKTKRLIKIALTNNLGIATFIDISFGNYFCRFTRVGYTPVQSDTITIQSVKEYHLPQVSLSIADKTLSTVTVHAQKPFIEMGPGKTTINMEASITSVGATALEALEKLPGITLDRDGNISLKGRPGVLILLDGKQTYLGKAELASLLSGMSAAQISQVEIMDQPSAKYDAAGNAGIINIKTKKTQQKGFNGTFNTSYLQGHYARNNNSLQLTYRAGNVTLFANYSANIFRNFTRVYALRTYFDNNYTPLSLLEQPSFIKSKGHSHTLQTGIDFSISSKTNIGLGLNGLSLIRNSNGNNRALWMKPTRAIDSLIQTTSNNGNNMWNGGINLNLRHLFSSRRELTADADFLQYRLRGNQFFENISSFPNPYLEASEANIPSDIKIYAAKADYTQQFKKVKLESGWKTSHIVTDNLAAYQQLENGIWKEDEGKSNHFLYNETIHSIYTSLQAKRNEWQWQGGLRYELTDYNGKQLGNRSRKDSSFSRSYNSLFPTVFLAYAVDSNHTFSLNAGRRIDRPAFQKLNPFLFIINKYTFQQGNPFLLPQYTWNIEISHQYKNTLNTAIRYSQSDDYFSQLFLSDNTGLIIYTDGNLGRMQNLGASLSLNLSPAKWWSFSVQLNGNHKKLQGQLWKTYRANITQMNISSSHQFRFKKGWTGEVSGFYNSRSQQDLQEVLDPSGQLSLGLAKTLFKNKATLKLTARDIFYTQIMQGDTEFKNVHEFFRLTRDTRVAALSFTYKFGKSIKTSRRESAVSDEIKRVGSGN